MELRDRQEREDLSRNGQSSLACGGCAGHVTDQAFRFARRQEASRALGRENDDDHEGTYKSRCRGCCEVDDRAGLSCGLLKHRRRRTQRCGRGSPGAAEGRGCRLRSIREGDASAEDLFHCRRSAASLDRGPGRLRVGREGLSGARWARVAAR